MGKTEKRQMGPALQMGWEGWLLASLSAGAERADGTAGFPPRRIQDGTEEEEAAAWSGGR